jgi:hypothetical protein
VPLSSILEFAGLFPLVLLIAAILAPDAACHYSLRLQPLPTAFSFPQISRPAFIAPLASFILLFLPYYGPFAAPGRTTPIAWPDCPLFYTLHFRAFPFFYLPSTDSLYSLPSHPPVVNPAVPPSIFYFVIIDTAWPISIYTLTPSWNPKIWVILYSKRDHHCHQ